MSNKLDPLTPLGCSSIIVGILSVIAILYVITVMVSALIDPAIPDEAAVIILIAAVAIGFTLRDIFGSLIKAFFGK